MKIFLSPKFCILKKANFVDAKLQVLANLANFAYDPINYEALRQLNAVELFVDMLTEENPKLVEFGIGGICNCCLGLFRCI